MKVHPSALKHGGSSEDAIQAAEWSVWIEPLDENGPPDRELRLCFDTRARLLETVVLVFEIGSAPQPPSTHRVHLMAIEGLQNWQPLVAEATDPLVPLASSDRSPLRTLQCRAKPVWMCPEVTTVRKRI